MCATQARNLVDVVDAVVLSENPFELPRNRPCMIVTTLPGSDRDKLREQIRVTLKESVKGAFQVRDLSAGRFPNLEWPIRVAVAGPKGSTYESVFSEARKLGDSLSKAEGLANLMLNEVNQSHETIMLEIDESTVESKKVALEQVYNVLQERGFIETAARFDLRSDDEGNFDVKRNRGPWPCVGVGMADGLEAKIREALLRATIKSTDGSMIPLPDLVCLRKRSGPSVIERIDGRMVVELYGTIVPGKSLKEVRRECGRLASAFKLSPGFQIISNFK